MKTLFVLTSLSDEMVDSAIGESFKSNGQVIFVDLDDGIRANLKSLGLSSIPVRVERKMDWGKRDTEFRALAMPGKQLACDFPGTGLPIWKVLSLDRFSFLYRGEVAQRQYDAIMALDWNKAIVPLDMYHPLPWHLARYSGREVTAIQVSPLRTREWLDILESTKLPFLKVVTSSDKDKKFLEKYFNPVECNDVGTSQMPAKVGEQEYKSVRKALGIPDGAKTALVPFTSQCEWEFRVGITQVAQKFAYIVIVPMTEGDKQHLLKTASGIFNERIFLADSLSIESGCDECVLFRYDESVLRSRRIPVNVMDVTGRWLSKGLVAE